MSPLIRSRALALQRPTILFPLSFRNTSRAFSQTTSQKGGAAGDHHEESRFDPPGGWLWGVKPGEKREKEGWEFIWMWGFFGSLGLATVAYAFKPDTSIQTWALEEARRRLEAEGILPDPDKEPKDGQQTQDPRAHPA